MLKNSRSYSVLKFSFFWGIFGNLGKFWCGAVLARPDLAGAARGLGGRLRAVVLREVYDIYESSYRIMGDNLGGGKQVNH